MRVQIHTAAAVVSSPDNFLQMYRREPARSLITVAEIMLRDRDRRLDSAATPRQAPRRAYRGIIAPAYNAPGTDQQRHLVEGPVRFRARWRCRLATLVAKQILLPQPLRPDFALHWVVKLGRLRRAPLQCGNILGASPQPKRAASSPAENTKLLWWRRTRTPTNQS
jgi:hypothetical protein